MWFRSPLHDKDFNKNKTIKKPHYHCVLSFSSLKSYEQVSEITSEIGATIPQVVYNMRSCARYSLHLDNPEKAQYEIKDLKCFNGFDIEKYIFNDKDLELKRLNALKEIYDFIEQQGITEFHQINTYARKNEPYWFEILHTNSAYAINLHIKSVRYSLEGGLKNGKYTQTPNRNYNN